jgi:TRAP-type C4-dicarboxylate transport system permease small subunit
MDETLRSLPAEAWPLIDLLFNATCVVTAIWLATTTFIIWRRASSNLTTASSVTPNRKATPDFLTVDEKARKEAIKRGEQFDKELDKRDREDERKARRLTRRKETAFRRITRLISLFMAFFSLATVISGTVFQVSFMGSIWEQYSASERLLAVIRAHPIGVGVTVIVILYNLVTFVTNRKWEEN